MDNQPPNGTVVEPHSVPEGDSRECMHALDLFLSWFLQDALRRNLYPSFRPPSIAPTQMGQQATEGWAIRTTRGLLSVTLEPTGLPRGTGVGTGIGFGTGNGIGIGVGVGLKQLIASRMQPE